MMEGVRRWARPGSARGGWTVTVSVDVAAFVSELSLPEVISSMDEAKRTL
jgi:hypothetical protein